MLYPKTAPNRPSSSAEYGATLTEELHCNGLNLLIYRIVNFQESMKIMGLPNWLHWTAWFLKCFIFLLISAILMTVLLKVKWYTNSDNTVFTHSNAIVFFVFLIFYVSATITFCFALSVFFSKGNRKIVKFRQFLNFLILIFSKHCIYCRWTSLVFTVFPFFNLATRL